MPHEGDDQLLLRPEDHVAVEVLGALLEQVGDQGLEARSRDEEVHVRRAEVADVGATDEIADRAVHRDRVALRRDGPYAVGAVVPAGELAAQPGLVHLELGLVRAVAVGLPHVEHGARDRLALEVAHHAEDVERVTLDADGHVPGVAELRGALDVEGAEHRGGRGPVVEAVVQLHDQHGQAEDVGGEDELLALVVGHLTGARQPLDGGHPLVLGEPDLAGEVVQVPHQTGEDSASRGSWAVPHRARRAR